MKEKRKKENLPKTNSLFFYLILAIISFAPYFSLLNADFVNWDDDIYVTQNAKVTKGLTLDNIKWAFSTTYFGFYYPITWISHMIDVSLYGFNPKGHHLTNIIIHILNTILLFSFLLKGSIDKIKSFIISALFAVHPLNVESIGWISERKNLLAAFFFLLGINLYLNYVKNPLKTNLAMVLAAYLFGLMSKSNVVTFPIALYLIDIWPLKRIELSINYIKENFGRLLKEKLLFLIPVPVFAYLTIVAQKEVSALSTFDSYPLDQRIAGAMLAYGRYVYQFVFPLKLTAFYPHLRNNYSIVLLLINILIVCGVLFFFIKLLKKEPLYLTGYLWFICNLLPVIGIIQVGEQGSADRYMYIPMIGLLWIFVYALFYILSRIKIVKIVHIFGFFFVIFLIWGLKAHNQCKVWMNSDTLFENMIKESPNPAQGYINAGLQFKMKKDYLTAVEFYKKAIDADPLKASAYNNLGSALYELKDIKEANKAFKKAVELNPNHPVMVYNLALSEELLGNKEIAKKLYQKALEIKRTAPAPRKRLIKIYESESSYLDALRLSKEGEKYANYDPEFARETVLILISLERFQEAKEAATERLKIFQDDFALLFLYSLATFRLGEFEEAEIYCAKSLSFNPKNVEALLLMADIKLKQNEVKEAFAILQRGLELNPSDSALIAKLKNLSQSYYERGEK